MDFRFNYHFMNYPHVSYLVNQHSKYLQYTLRGSLTIRKYYQVIFREMNVYRYQYTPEGQMALCQAEIEELGVEIQELGKELLEAFGKNISAVEHDIDEKKRLLWNEELNLLKFKAYHNVQL